jgi:peptide/nickel transport system permease protein
MMVDSIGRRDCLMIQALPILFALANMIVNLGIDPMYAVVNPRIRYA